ncbi:hypothetical protein [Steroidobacter sp.]|uniref:hypothetical protein n=1 Tax=Steroidobacter sp. TaxID=1978227 RepID=UPI001A4B24A8|nr:hypothetical protein [Steroidobacter sp.]MBL8266412.1 hypothetical protein [Steroidobacter sp.]
MMEWWLRRGALASLILLLPAIALAHSFSTPYLLPIPYWMYVYGCAATLIVTFAVLGVFASRPASDESSARSRPLEVGPGMRAAGRRLLIVLRVAALACLSITIAAGFVGSEDPLANVSLPLFWVVFLLGWGYLTVLVGDLYPFVNPWLTIIGGLERIGVPLSKARMRYPQWLGCWPAFGFYLWLVWTELFVVQTPLALSNLLLIYSAVTLLGVVVFGKRDWFEQADFFSVFFSIVGKMAPVAYDSDGGEQIREVRLRRPFSGLLSEQPKHMSVLLFVLFMLSSTAYDGIYDTQLWTAFFWKNMLGLLQPLWGDDLGKAQALLMDLFLVYRKAGLLLFPFLYLIFYYATLLLAKLITRSSLSLRSLALQFCYSLVPIAFVYHFAHYYTFLIVQFRELPSLLGSLVGIDVLPPLLTSPDAPPTGALEMGIVWHTQVGVVLLGHVVSVVLAHFEALRSFPGRGNTLLSQVPLLILMVTYTMLGLWILTLPLG